MAKSTVAGLGDLDKHYRPKGKSEAGLKDRIRDQTVQAVKVADPKPIKTALPDTKKRRNSRRTQFG